MQSEQSIFHCPYCGHQFDQTRHRPMILCISQHTSCNQCVQKMFRNKSKQEQIDCPFRCSKIQFANIKPFRHFKEIVETKCELKTMKSVLRKQKISYDNEKFNKINKIKELEQQLVKEREKNEWLIQINQKKQRISSQTHTDKIIKQLSKEFKKQRQKMEESVRQVLAEMLKQNKTLKSKFEEHGERITQKISVVELETKKNQKTLQKQVDEQIVIIRQLQQSLKPLEKIEKNMVTSREFEDVLSKSIKHLEADKTNNNKNVMKTDESLKLNKVESKNVQKDEVKNDSAKKESEMSKPQIKHEKKYTYKNYLNLPLPDDFQNGVPLFQKKNNTNIVFEAKKEQKVNKYQIPPLKFQKTSEKLKTEPSQKYQAIKMKYPDRAINPMRASIGPYNMPSFTERNNDEVDTSAKTSRDNNSFKLQYKNIYKYQSQKNLLGNKSMLEYEAAQQKKVDAIMEKLQKMHGKFMVSSKSTKLKAFINEQIHLSEKEIIEKIGSKFRFQVV